MAFVFPSSPSVGTQYVSTAGPIYLYDSNTSWTSDGNTQTSNPFMNSFRYRTIITHGYVLGGYKDSSPWKNVNRTIHATDVTANLGDKLDYGASYANGGYSDYNAYVYGVADSFSGGSYWTTSMSMATEANRAHNTNWDTKSYRDDTGVMINASNTMGYITGTDTTVDKHNYVTETMYAAGSVPAGPTAGSSYGNVASWMGQTIGWIWAGGGARLTFATETWASGGTTVGTDGWGKALSSKLGYAYVKNGGNCVTGAFKLDDTTGTQLRTDLNFDYSGEENYQMGQNWGYCLGHYNGAQNCNSYRVNYLTDAYTVLGTTAQPKGHDGMSSGTTAPAAASLVGVLF